MKYCLFFEMFVACDDLFVSKHTPTFGMRSPVGLGLLTKLLIFSC